jgi:nicotinate-nucleotide pyrophosphorylase (carboxylating)
MAEYAHLLATNYKTLVTEYLAEDVPSFDYGGYVVGDEEQTAILYCKAEGVVAGVPFFDEVFHQLGCR